MPQTAGSQTAGSETAGSPIAQALRQAAIAGLIALLLTFPILTHETVVDQNNNLVLQTRWPMALAVAGLITVAAFAIALWRANRATGQLVRGPSAATAAWVIPPWLVSYGPRIGLAMLVLYPAFVVSLAGWPAVLKWVDNFGVQILIYVMLAWGLNIVVGLAGLLDLGYVAFYAVGAYAYAIMATQVIPALAPALVPYAFYISLPIAGLLAALWGMILGFPVLRLRGDYLAVVTLAFGEIIRLVLINWESFSNGYKGIQTARITFFGLPFTTRGQEQTFNDVFSLTGNAAAYRAIFLYYVILALALFVAFVTQRLRRLPIGRAWEALREDEIASRALGINSTTTKLTAFAIGAMFAGFAGAFFGVRQAHVSPKSFEFIESATILAIVVLGGMGSLGGVALAAVLVIGGTELLRDLDILKAVVGSGFDPVQYRMVLFGLAMVMLMIWRPRGLVSTREPSIIYKEKKAVPLALVNEGHG